MKILLISSSPHKGKSRTFALAKEVLRGLSDKKVHTEVIHLCDLKIDYCRHCEECHKKIMRCPIKDDVHEILNKMLQADGIILASPNYINQVTASMKALFDRSAHFIHCKRLLGKYILGVVSSGSGYDKAVLDYLAYYAHACGAQYSGGVSSAVPVSKEKMAEAFTLGNKFISDIVKKIKYPEQTNFIERGREHFKKIILLRKKDWPEEYKYWQEKGSCSIKEFQQE